MSVNHLHIVHVTQKGQCLVARRDIKPLEVILTDTPSVLGPPLGSDMAVCSLCLRVSQSRCCHHVMTCDRVLM